MFLLISPSYSHRLGCAVTGYQRDEPGDVGVLQRGRDAKGGGKKNPIQWSDKNHLHTTVERTDARVCKTHSYDDADSRHTRGGHDFGTVGDEVEQDGNDGFRSMVEFIPQHCREVATRIHTEKYSTNMLWSQNTIKVVGKAIIKVGRNLINVHYSLLDPHKVVAVLLGS